MMRARRIHDPPEEARASAGAGLLFVAVPAGAFPQTFDAGTLEHDPFRWNRIML